MNFTKEEISKSSISEIYSYIMPAIEPFLEENDYFNTSKEEIEKAFYKIIEETKKDNFNEYGVRYINYVKEAFLNKFPLYEENDFVAPDSVKAYFKDISQYPLLTKEDEENLYKEIENGNKEVKKTIINSNLRLVVSLAKNYAAQGYPLLDMIQEGNVGLIKAADKFNINLGYKFSTYATWWITHYIRRAIINKEKFIRIPAYMYALSQKIKKAKYDFIREHGYDPTDKEIAELLGLEEEVIKTNKLYDYEVVSSNIPMNEEENTELADLIPSDEDLENDIIDNSLNKELKIYFKEANLSNEEIYILIHHFGLGDEKQYSFEQIGKNIGKGKERVRLMLTKSLLKLKRCPYKNKIINYYDEKLENSPKKILKY